MQLKVAQAEALGRGQRVVEEEANLEHRLKTMEKTDQVDRLLMELKMRALADANSPQNLLAAPDAGNGHKNS
jgi:hypothetical protein